ncbi:MAG: ECF transporter S component [Butyricicoccus pullicaecorum]|nr:ECF transporter S component [Butyricicoccus pullicaecorum]
MKQNTTRTLVLAALLAAFTTVATMIIKIPTPTMGYIHLGDGLVLLCGILLGPGLGAAAAGIGSMFADIFSGYAAWAPATLIIKAATAFLGGWVFHKLHVSGSATPVRTVLAGIPAEIVMVFGYYVYEVGLAMAGGSAFGAAAVATASGVPFNIVQGAAGVIVSAVLLPVLSRASGDLRARIHA